MTAFGMKALEEGTGRSLSILYRWKRAIEDGRGISDRNKKALIAVTAGSAHAIEWGDFEPPALQDAA